jgi:hypothetical protein
MKPARTDARYCFSRPNLIRIGNPSFQSSSPKAWRSLAEFCFERPNYFLVRAAHLSRSNDKPFNHSFVELAQEAPRMVGDASTLLGPLQRTVIGWKTCLTISGRALTGRM